MAGKKADGSVEEKPVEAPKPSSGGEDNLFGALCYIITLWVPLFVLFTDKKTNKFLAFHAWQSLILSVVWVVVFGGFSVITGILTVFSGIGALLSCLLFPLGGVALLAHLFLAYKAYQGETYKLPIVGEFAEKQVAK
ncbi:MAG: DUF4870 domain-containing protein [Candidatus Micrarchaeota archaeon]